MTDNWLMLNMETMCNCEEVIAMRLELAWSAILSRKTHSKQTKKAIPIRVKVI